MVSFMSLFSPENERSVNMEKQNAQEKQEKIIVIKPPRKIEAMGCACLSEPVSCPNPVVQIF